VKNYDLLPKSGTAQAYFSFSTFKSHMEIGSDASGGTVVLYFS